MKRDALPNLFKEYLQEVVGAAKTEIVLSAIESSTPPVSIRLNPYKPVPFGLLSVVSEAKERDDRIPWCSDGYYLEERPAFTLDPAFHAGAYYVQEPSSMILELLRPILSSGSQSTSLTNGSHSPSLSKEGHPPVKRVLDLCAAPGGKSTHLISMLSPDDHVVVNEVVKNRVGILKENILKWGNHNVKIISREARDVAAGCLQMGEQFDFILVDAPCSGEGMFRKDPNAILEWSEQNVKMCAARQKQILLDIWPALAPGGLLAYSTCTFNLYENDLNIEWFKQNSGAESVMIEDLHPGNLNLTSQIDEWGVVRAECGGYRLLPGLLRGEGLFFCLLKKPGSQSGGQKFGTEFGGQKFGTEPGGQKLGSQSGSKSDFDPRISPEGALSLALGDQFPKVEVSREVALRYLKRDAVQLVDAPLGFVVITYGGLPLGFAKNVGTRANNLYPKSWRIRKDLSDL
ncbi:MAG: rRNA cytosine-C5-methyltransferase [Bacteroidales bacterium]|nr:rRNA cytosine-C5-methyltransferase [Bacteroidales bacterium]